MYKLVVLVREDLMLSPGKLAVQVAHACVECVLKSRRDIIEKWRRGGSKKVVLKVKNLEELLYYKKLAEEKKLVTTLVTDAGKTEVPEDTITCLGIGPDMEQKIDEVTGRLKLL